MPRKAPGRRAGNLALAEEIIDDLEDDQPRSGKAEIVKIKAPSLMTARVPIVGFAPLCIHRFDQKQQQKMAERMEQGERSRKNVQRDPRDFDADFVAAQYRAPEGWHGFAASSIRNALISACRLCGFTMTRAKLSIFCEPDGFDAIDSTPLVRITKGKPKPYTRPVRNEGGVADIRCRPLWERGWEAAPVLTWDADQFDEHDVMNLVSRAGLQVGIGEGRPDSKKSNGIGFGRFKIGATGRLQVKPATDF